MTIKNSYSVLIAEDELPSRELLVEYLIKRPELRLEGIAKNGEEALEKLREKKYNMLFLDINLPVMTGIEVLEKLDEIPYLIFTTAYDKYAIKAFELGAIDYLLKPFTQNRFNQAVDKALLAIKSHKKNLESAESLGFSFKEGENYYIVPYEEIIYISSSGRHIVVHTEEKDFEISGLLKDLEVKLSAYGSNSFFRIHKQFIVNIRFVARYQYILGGQYEIYLKDSDETALPVGRKYALPLKEKLKY